MLTQKFGTRKVVIVGSATDELAKQLEQQQVPAVVCQNAPTLAAAVPRNGHTPADLAVWIFGHGESDDDAMVPEIARVADNILLVPGAGTEPAKRRPRLVERLRGFGLMPDYGCDVTDLDAGAVLLTRAAANGAPTSLPAVESAFARLNQQMRGLERILRTRMSELEAADRHIAKLEEKVLSLKEAKRELKQLKLEKHALRKCPERKIGQVILAPYRLPQKLIREVAKRRQPPPADTPRPTAHSAREYQAWFARHRVTPQEVSAMRTESRGFKNAPLISIITPVFN
ncbi:MAG: hypothetical protein H0T11_08140, partial [Chthoniobacterales bacterium]|nr:hypothetical protein [Chthoniobacterales bacterium]